MARGKNKPLTEKDLAEGLAKLNKKPEELGFKKPLRNILGEAQGVVSEQSYKPDMPEMDNTERLRQMASAIQGKITVERGAGAANETIAKQNATVFENFINQSKKRDELLQTATEEQRDIYKELEKTLADLAQANTHDSKELRKTLAVLSGKLSGTDPTKARENIANMLQDARANAEPASFGRAFKSLLGSDRKTREGYAKEGNGYRNLTTGQYASKAEATHGRFGSALGFATESMRNRIREDIDAQRDAKDPFSRGLRWISGKNSEANRTRLGEYQGLIAALQSKAGKGSGGGGMFGGGGAAATGGPMNLEGAIVNITAKELKSKTDKAIITANSAEMNSEDLTGASGGAGGGGGGVGVDVGLPGGGGNDGKNKKTPFKLRAKNYLKGLGKGLLKGGVATVAGMGLEYGADKLKESGHETAGKNVGIGAKALEWGGTGAMLGSFLGPEGTVIGGALGGLAGAAKGTWDSYGSDIKKFGAKQLGLPTADTAKASAEGAGVNPLSSMVQQLTGVNLDMAGEAAQKPIIVNTPQAAAPATESRNPSPGVVLPRANIRPDESYLEKYTNRNSMFY